MMVVVPAHLRSGSLVSQYLRRAGKFAADRHAGQTRKDGKTPYITHPFRVAKILKDAGVHDAATIAAALLHDTVEDCGVSHADIAKRFGKDVADAVAELTDQPGLKYRDRKEAQVARAASMSPRAAAVKLADKIANMSDLVGEARPASVSDDYVRNYFDHALRVAEAMRNPHPALSARLKELHASRRPS